MHNLANHHKLCIWLVFLYYNTLSWAMWPTNQWVLEDLWNSCRVQ